MERIRDLVIRAAGEAGAQEDRLRAFGRLVEMFQDMACGYAYAILGDFHLAQDAAQVAFITAYRRLGTLLEPEAFPGWLRRIVQTSCTGMTRRKTLPLQSLEAAAEVAVDADSPAAAAEKAEIRDEVLRAIRGLGEPEREVTTLFYINGYSQKDIAGFLEVPVSTVKNRLHASRRQLKERMLNMVEQTLHQNAPDERFSREVIDSLLSRPRPLEIEGHPVRQVWQILRAAMADYGVVTGEEVEDRQTFDAAQDRSWDSAYRLGEDKALRYQMTTVTMKAIRGRTAPVRLLAAGRVFRPDRENTGRAKVFHQVDAVCIEAGADVVRFKATCEAILKAAAPEAIVHWEGDEYPSIVAPGFMAVLAQGSQRYETLGGGMLSHQTLRDAGYDPQATPGFSWGLSLERLAMLRFGIDDIHKLWQPPYLK